MSVFRYWFVLIVALAGCQFTPAPTSKTVTTNDVTGVWSFPEDYGKTTVFITFAPSGIFTQQVVTTIQTNIQVGRWSLDGPHLELTDFLAKIDGGWKPYSMHWYLIDGGKRKLEIFGGAFPDPDSYQNLSYLRAAQ
jgi:hypothetical protein